jgi:bifunctional UDP-N-acetylglucosamine pyrophosphorylase/glucosamine-1-phosphate N-acetyltransferase
VIFANYDGVTKSMTTVGAYSFVGSDTVLVAPVRVADGTYVAAGSVITGDVEPGELAVSRARQRNVAGWVARKRAGTKTAAAAEAADAGHEPAERPHSEPVEGRPSTTASPLMPEEGAQ